jgi:hypothetical protein
MFELSPNLAKEPHRITSSFAPALRHKVVIRSMGIHRKIVKRRSNCRQSFVSAIRMLFVDHSFHNVRSNRAFEPLGIHVVTDETETTVRQPAQYSFLAKLLQALDRKNHITVEVGIVVRIFQLVNPQIPMLGIRKHTQKNGSHQKGGTPPRARRLQVNAAGAELINANRDWDRGFAKLA